MTNRQAFVRAKLLQEAEKMGPHDTMPVEEWFDLFEYYGSQNKSHWPYRGMSPEKFEAQKSWNTNPIVGVIHTGKTPYKKGKAHT